MIALLALLTLAFPQAPASSLHTQREELAGEAAPAVTPVPCGPSQQAGGRIQGTGAFIPNRGQWDEGVLYGCLAGNLALTVTRDALVVRNIPGERYDPEMDSRPTVEPFDEFVIRFGDGQKPLTIREQGVKETYYNFFLGTRSAVRVPGFAELVLEEVQPGIDVSLGLDPQGRPRWHAHLDAGIRPEDFRFSVEAPASQRVEEGELLALGQTGVLRQCAEFAWPLSPTGSPGTITPVRFEIRAGQDETFGLVVPAWTPAEGWVLDPTLEFGSYLGNSQLGFPPEAAEMAANSDFIVGFRSSTGMIGTPGSIQPLIAGLGDMGIARFRTNDSSLAWMTFLGGTEAEYLDHVLERGSGLAVLGQTWSAEFPIVGTPLQGQLVNPTTEADIAITLLSAEGDSVQWSTVLGGTDSENAQRAAVLPDQDLVLAVYDAMPDCPLLVNAGYDPVWAAGKRLFLRIDPEIPAVVAHTYFYAMPIYDMVVTPDGDLLFSGNASADKPPAPTTPGVLSNFHPNTFEDFSRGYIGKLSADLTTLIAGTYIPGGNLVHFGLGTDPSGSIYAAGRPGSLNLLALPGSFQVPPVGKSGYLIKIAPNLTRACLATYIGVNPGTAGDLDWVFPGNDGHPVVIGAAGNSGWPITPDALQPAFAGSFATGDLYIGKLDPLGETLLYGSWYGGNGNDNVPLADSLGDGKVGIAFVTSSSNLLLPQGTYDPSYDGNIDVGIVGFDLGLEPWRVLGGGMKGSIEMPVLVGTGKLLPGTPTRLALRAAEPNQPLWWVGGFSEIQLPLLGGTLVPFPEIVLPGQTDSLGWADFHFNWPNVPPGLVFTVQAWCLDPLAPQLFGASNALQALAQ